MQHSRCMLFSFRLKPESDLWVCLAFDNNEKLMFAYCITHYKILNYATQLITECEPLI